jgi:glycosyltransferase involved in cell wall biosynthesis
MTTGVEQSPALDGGRALRICLASMAPFVGGAEVAAERLALGLRDAGHEVVVILGRPGEVLRRMERAGLRCLVTPMCFTDARRPWRFPLARARLRRLLRRERPDVVHANDLPTHQILSAAARGLGPPVVCHHRFPFGGEAIDWFDKYGADRHLFVSRALMDQMCAASPRLAAAERSVVYDGLELPPRPTEEDRRDARRRLGLPPGRVLVLFAGQVIERKGVEDLIRAWAALGPDGAAGADLLIVGDDLQGGGAYRAAMEELAGRLGCPARFVGFRPDVAAWLVAADVAAVPSHVEPLGNATLEAMACARPVVGCRVGGIPEMVVHEETGLLVPPRAPGELAAALARLIGDADLRARCGERGRARCQGHFSLGQHVRSVVREYGRALRRVPAAPAP